ncbi:MAG: NAD-dependent epimerase/dehydratase family protein [Elainellaceae cyanobacterium]
MKAFITGINGFTGSHLARALDQRGDTIVGLVRKTSDLSRLADYDIQLVQGDITDRDALKTGMVGADVVFHIAAYVELGLVDDAKMETVNVEGTRAVIEVARDLGVPKMVYCSTIGVFGDTQGRVINETFERTQKDFSSAYDRTKYLAQQLVDQAASQGFHVISVMPSGIFGADDPHFGPVLKTFRNGKLRVWAGGDRVTGIVHVDDLVDGMILAAEKGNRGDYYIFSAGDMTTRDMFEFLSQETGMSAPIEIPEPIVRLVGTILTPVGRLLNWQPPISRERVHYIYDRCVRVDATKARQTLGWQPRSPEQTLRDSLK